MYVTPLPRGRRATALAAVLLAGCGVGEITGSGAGATSGAETDGGGGGGGEGDEADAGAGGGMWEAELAFCVDETNRYREMVDQPPLTRSAALEAYAAEGARIDHDSEEPHKHFEDTNGGGVAFAENEVQRWSVSQNGSVTGVVENALALMWSEGEGGPHRDTMAGGYATLGCGIWVDGDLATMVQDYAF